MPILRRNNVEDSNVTYMFILKCALKLVEEIILYYDARLKKHQITVPCLYIYALRLFAVKNLNIYQTNSSVHGMNTRQQNKQQYPR